MKNALFLFIIIFNLAIWLTKIRTITIGKIMSHI